MPRFASRKLALSGWHDPADNLFTGVIERKIRLHAGGNGHDHRFSNAAGDRQDVGGADPGKRSGNHDAGSRDQLRSPEGVTALPQDHRHAAQRIFAERTDIRDNHDSHYHARAQHGK